MKVKQIADFLNSEFTGDGDIEISKVASLEKAQTGEISFIENTKSFKTSFKTDASCLIVPQNFDLEFPISLIKVKNPKLAFAKVAGILHPSKVYTGEIHKTALIAETAKIGKNVFIGAFCCVGENSQIGNGTQLRTGAKIGDNVIIGKNSVMHPNVFVEDNSIVGNNVILHSGVIVGTDGFGYVRDEDENQHVKFPQIGRVIIEDNVEIGANSCIDRGSLGETRIGEGTKIDNLVQVAHNVKIGKRVIIASQTGISGSVTIEDDCIIAGQVGFGEHAKVEKGAIIGGKGGVFTGKTVRKGVWGGIPVQPLDEYLRQIAHIRSIPRLKEEIKKLKEKVNNSE